MKTHLTLFLYRFWPVIGLTVLALFLVALPALGQTINSPVLAANTNETIRAYEHQNATVPMDGDLVFHQMQVCTNSTGSTSFTVYVNPGGELWPNGESVTIADNCSEMVSFTGSFSQVKVTTNSTMDAGSRHRIYLRSWSY